MIGGHYCVRGPKNRIIGKELGLDKRRAAILAHELDLAHELGHSQRLLQDG